MKAFFQAVGIILISIMLIIGTIILIYLSYVLAIGLTVGFLVYVVYTLLSTNSSTPSNSQSEV